MLAVINIDYCHMRNGNICDCSYHCFHFQTSYKTKNTWGFCFMNVTLSLFSMLHCPQRTAEILFSFLVDNCIESICTFFCLTETLLLFFLPIFFPWLSRKISFMLKIILQEHICKEIHELPRYCFPKMLNLHLYHPAYQALNSSAEQVL